MPIKEREDLVIVTHLHSTCEKGILVGEFKGMGRLFLTLFLILGSDILSTIACPHCYQPTPSPPPPPPTEVPCPPPPSPSPPPPSPPPPKKSPPPPSPPPPSPPPPKKSPPPPSPPPPSPPPPMKSPPPPSPPPPTPVPCPPPPSPPPPPKDVPCPPPPTPISKGCPINALKLSACVDVLGGLIHIGIGGGAAEKCCPLLSGLADLDAALCLCTVIKAKVLNINLLLPIALEVLVNDCGKHVPSDFKCPS